MIPTIIIASLILEILKGCSIGGVNLGGLISGFFICFIMGLLCIKIMVNFVKKNRLQYFSYYLILLATFLLLNSLILKIF